MPVSALSGDMVVERGAALDWYRGPTLLERLLAEHADPIVRGVFSSRLRAGTVGPGEEGDLRAEVQLRLLRRLHELRGG